METNNHILIVGAGPVGLMLGCLLRQQGISCQIVDQLNVRTQMTRAIGVHASSLKLFEHLGILKDFVEKSVMTDKISFYWSGQRLVNIYPGIGEAPYNKFIYSKQPIIETLLEEKFYELGGSIDWGVQIKEVKEHDEGVKIISTKKGEYKEEFFAYIVGCDGSHSSIRNQLNVRYEKEEYGAYFVLIDAEIGSQFSSSYAHYYLNHDGYAMLIPIPNGQFRIIQSFFGDYPEKVHNQLSIQQLEEITSKRTNSSFQLKKVIWKTSAAFRHQFVIQNKSSRIFLAGDALHVFSPVGGTNMNFGFQDAMELSKCFNKIFTEDALNAVHAYHNNRTQAMYKNMLITKKSTFSIIRNQKRDISFDEKFLPKFKNRYFIKKGLVSQFCC